MQFLLQFTFYTIWPSTIFLQFIFNNFCSNLTEYNFINSFLYYLAKYNFVTVWPSTILFIHFYTIWPSTILLQFSRVQFYQFIFILSGQLHFIFILFGQVQFLLQFIFNDFYSIWPSATFVTVWPNTTLSLHFYTIWPNTMCYNSAKYAHFRFWVS